MSRRSLVTNSLALAALAVVSLVGCDAEAGEAPARQHKAAEPEPERFRGMITAVAPNKHLETDVNVVVKGQRYQLDQEYADYYERKLPAGCGYTGIGMDQRQHIALENLLIGQRVTGQVTRAAYDRDYDYDDEAPQARLWIRGVGVGRMLVNTGLVVTDQDDQPKPSPILSAMCRQHPEVKW